MKHSKGLFSILYKSFIVIFFLCHFESEAQDSLATIYFYRPGKAAGASIAYDVLDGEKVIGHISSNTVFEYRCQPGLRIFMATTGRESSIKLLVEGGMNYFIMCGLMGGSAMCRPSFSLAASPEAKRAISKINAVVADKIPGAMAEEMLPSDTVRAIHNLFRRKLHGGIARGVVFAVLDGLVIINAIGYTPGTTNKTEDSPLAADYAEIFVFTCLTITGFTQADNYGAKNLTALLEDYKNGHPLPEKIKRRLKEKDFR